MSDDLRARIEHTLRMGLPRGYDYNADPAEVLASRVLAALPEADRDEVADVIYDETDAAIRGHEITSDLQWPDAQAAADALLSRYHLIRKGADQ